MMNINYSTNTKELISKLDTTVNAAWKASDEQHWTDFELFSDNVKTLIKDVNAAIIEDASKAFVAIFENDGPAAFVETYFSDWFAPKYYGVTENGIMIEVREDGEQRILLSHIDKVSKKKIAAAGDWRDWLSIYVDNVARAKSKNAAGENAVFTKTALPSHLLNKRDKSEKFWKMTGNSDLTKQLNAVVRMMLPADFQPDFRFLSADNVTVMDGIFRDKDVHAMDGVHKSYVKTATAEALILRQVNTRMHNLAIDFQTGFKEKTERKNAPAKDEAKAAAPVKGGKADAPQNGALRNAESKPVPADKNTAA